MKRAVLVYASLLLTAAARAESLEGTVEDSVTQAPVRQAEVTLSPMSSPRSDRRLAAELQWRPLTTITDRTGHFRFEPVSPGRYLLIARHPMYRSNKGRDDRKIVEFESGSPDPVTLQLVPGGAITGRITDKEGDPVRNCVPSLISASGAAASGRTMPSNEDGEYRISAVVAGKYRLKLQCGTAPFEPRPLSPARTPVIPTVGYAPQYYSSADTLAASQEVEVAPGSERSGIDFHLETTRVYNVTVSLDGVAGDPGATRNAIVRLEPVDRQSFGGSRGYSRNANGEIVFRSVFPGSYTLVASLPGPPPLAAVRRVEVNDRPVTMTVHLDPSFEVSGRVEIEGDSDQPTPVTQVHISAYPQAGYLDGMNMVQPDASGAFTLKTVFPAAYRLQAFANGLFVKSITFGRDEAKDGVLDFAAGSDAELRIRMSSRTATLSGTSEPGYSVWVRTAETDAQRISGQYTTPVDPQGNYKLQGLAPGKYRVAAVEQGGSPPEGGQEITLAEGESRTLDVKPEK